MRFKNIAMEHVSLTLIPFDFDRLERHALRGLENLSHTTGVPDVSLTKPLINQPLDKRTRRDWLVAQVQNRDDAHS